MKQLNKLLSAFSTKTLMLLSFFALLPITASAQCPDDNHPHMIDLGLPSGTKWACCNLGSSKPEDYGGYFAWGETTEKNSYTDDNYLHIDEEGKFKDIGTVIAGTEYDAATANWGNSWVMPNVDQMNELIEKCTSEWMTEKGVNGRRFTGPNGASIFLPAAGNRWGSELWNTGWAGLYWLSTLHEASPKYGWYLGVGSGEDVGVTVYERFNGLSIRPVVAGSSTPSGNIDFADPAVKAICVANWDTNGDGELSYEEAAAVTGLGGVFEYNNAITIFNELKHFTGLTSIGMQEFFRCKNLTSISIPNSVTDIGMNAFNGCSSLTSIIIPNSVTSISYNAFNDCVSLTTITIPSSVTSIGYIAFWGCSGLASINVEKGNPVYDSRDNCNAIINTKRNELIAGCQNTIIPNTVTSIGDGAFYGNSSLKAVIIPNSVTNIDAGAFWHCSGLASIIIEEGNAIYDSRDNCNAIIKTSNNELIVGCKNTIIPNSVTSIKDYAFYGCSNMTKMVSLIENPFTINSNVWESINTDEIPLYVPSGCKAKYEATEGWNVFKNIVEMGASSSIAIDETNFPDKYFRNWVLAQEYGQDGVLTEDEIAGVTNIKIVRKNISNLIGIEYFTALTRLDVILCRQLTSLDVSKNTALRELICYSNSLTSLDVSKNTELTLLNCHENQLTSLVLPKNGALKELECYKNQIEGTAMDALIASLPETGGKLYAIMPGDNEKNVVTMEQVAAAKEKGWKTYYYSDDDGWVDYKIIPEGNIDFADPAVKALCVANWDTDGDGEMSYAEAAAVGDLGNVFSHNLEITSFNELQYFIGLRGIGYSAFAGTYLTSIIIPDNVSYIGQYAFELCYNLTSVTLGNEVEEIDALAFFFCRSLTSVAIPNSVTRIGYRAFDLCYGLTSVTIGNSVTSIGNDAFSQCGGLTSIKVESGNAKYDSRDNCNALIETESNTLIVGCMNTVIPNSVTTIGDRAFYTCSGLTSLTIPSSVNSIGEEAFTYCNGLASIKVERGNTRYDSRDDCNAIIETESNTLIVGCNNTIIPNSVTTIGKMAFCGSNLTSVTIPNSVTNIGDEAFMYCDGLASIKVESGNAKYDSRDNCNAIIETESNTLIVGCMNTIIPNSVTSIGNWAFGGCSGLASVTIPNSVTTIGNYAFSGCSGLEDVTIGSGVTKIGTCAFEYCRGLKEIRSMITDPFTCEIDYSCFSFGPSLLEVFLYVPAGTKEKYESAPNWNYFQNIVEMDIAPVEEGQTINIGDEIDENTNLEGTVVDNVFVNISNGDGGFDPVEGCLIVSKPTDDSAINGKDIFGDDFKDNYTGIVFKVNEGKGSIKVEAETQGNMVLKVKIGNSDPIEMELDGKLKVKFPYNVSEPTYVYIYGGMGAAGAKAMGANRAKSAADLLKIYGFEIVSDPSGIDAIENGQQADAPVYNLNGQRVNTPGKGIYIKNGRKVLMK